MQENQNQQATRNTRDRPPDRDANESLVLQRIIGEFTSLPPNSRRRMIETVSTFFGLSSQRVGSDPSALGEVRSPETLSAPFRFSEGEAPTPKEFMHKKAPTTDVERVACLAYYLTHYRGTPHFKTKDISDINMEAAQRRFSNTAFSVVNATNAGYLVPSVKGCKQLSSSGEQFVQALPDREAAREVLDRLKPRRGGKRVRRKAARTSNN